MQPVVLGGAVRVVEHGRVVGAAEQSVIQPAGGHQPTREAAEPADPSLLVQPRPDQPDRGPPGQRLAAQPGLADVEAAVHQHLEAEP
jgi:hypothetical protein